MDQVAFGGTGLRVSRLAVGTGTHGWGGRSDQSALGRDRLADLLRRAYEWGVTFWDTADAYGTHPHVARALQGLPRERVVIATKTTSRTAQTVRADVERFLRELGTDYLDVLLLHYVTDRDWPTRYAGAMEALSRARERGQVRAVGVSCHGLAPLEAAAASDWPDVTLVRINHAGVNMDGPPERVAPIIERLFRAGKGVYGMKVLGCGRLVSDPRAAIRYVLSLGTVHAMTIGVTGREQLEQNLRLVEELAPGCPLREPQAASAPAAGFKS